MAAKCDPDSIYLDGMEGSTGAGPHIAAANTGIPGIAAIREARRALDDWSNWKSYSYLCWWS